MRTFFLATPQLHIVHPLFLYVTEAGEDVWYIRERRGTLHAVIVQDDRTGEPGMWDWIYTDTRGWEFEEMSRLRPESGFERTVANEKSYLWLRRSPDHRNWG